MSALPVYPLPAASQRSAEAAEVTPARTRHLRVVGDADLRRAELEFEARQRALAAAGRWAQRQQAPQLRDAAPTPEAPRPAAATAEAPLVLTARGRAVVRALVATAAVALAIAVGALIGGLFSAAPVAGESVTVNSGDTLWSIASAEVPGADVRDVVTQIMALNGLESSTVQAGQVIVLPAN